MKKNILKISIIAIILILLIQLNSFATANITMETKTICNIYNIGGTVKTTIDWTKGMQATGFTLEYDSTKLSFNGASIADDYYSTSTGKINVSWASLEEIDFTNIKFTFTALAKGEATISITNVDFLVDGNLESAGEIDYTTKGTKTISIRQFGDVNLDGIVNTIDATELERYIVGYEGSDLGEEALRNADVNLDGVVNEKDKEILGNYASTLEGYETLPVILYGDVNLDGIVNSTDRMTLAKYLAGYEENELSEYAKIRANVDLNEKIDQRDNDIIARHIASWKAFETLPVENYGNGDVNDDGITNIKDSTEIQKLVAGLNHSIKSENLVRGDVNEDGLIDKCDSVIIARYIAEWDGYELPMKVVKNLELTVSNLGDNIIIKGFDTDNHLTVSSLLEEFESDIKSVYDANDQELTEDKQIGTGTKVKIEENYEQELEILNGSIAEYELLIYGDVTGDGKINAVDALALIKDINNKIALTDEIYREAGKIMSDDTSNPTAVDALAIIKHANGRYTINQSK